MGFNNDTGEFTVRLSQKLSLPSSRIVSLQGLPKEWQQLLDSSGITHEDQQANPQAVVDVVAFYQDATRREQARPGDDDDEVWGKFQHLQTPTASSSKHGGPTALENPRPAPAPPSAGPGKQLDRSMSTREPARPAPAPPKPQRSVSQRSPGPAGAPSRPAPPPPSTSTQAPQASPANPPAGSAPPAAIPRKKKAKLSDAEVIERLNGICTDADPTKLYRSFTKIGQG